MLCFSYTFASRTGLCTWVFRVSFVSTLCFSYTFASRTGLSGIFLRPCFAVTLELHFKSKGILHAYNTSLCIIFLEPTARVFKKVDADRFLPINYSLL